MPATELYLFDDEIGRDWHPFALTRPIGELLFGALTLRARAERVFGARCSAHIAADHLLGFDEEGSPPVVGPPEGAGAVPRIFLLSRFVPDWRASPPADLEEGPILGPEGAVVGWYAPAASSSPPPDFFLRPDDHAGPGSRLEGTLLERPWNLVSRNPDQIGRDLAALHPRAAAPALPTGVHRWGDHPLIVDSSATIEAGAVFDTSGGPIWLDRGSQVRAFTRLAGPAYLGPGSTLLGGPVEAVSIGPVCRIRGEFAESVALGYANKQHDGHMGHAYLGRWVNLGAETTNSDLKNNYGTIKMWAPGGAMDTGEIKMGSLLGDHVKTGIGLLLNTGTLIGAGSNLYGSVMPPTYVPPFSWGTGSELVEYRLEKFLEVAERAMGRRNVRLSEEMREQLARAWTMGRTLAGTEAPPAR